MKTTSPLARMILCMAVFAALALPFSGLANPVTIASELGGPRCVGDDCLPTDPPPPVVKIRVRVPACGEPGQPIRYHICIENCSRAEAHHVMVKDALPANAKFVSADPKPNKMEPELQWNLGTIGGGASREIILVLQPTNKEDVKNCARVQFEHGQCVTTRLADLRPPGDRPPIITPVPPDKLPIFDLELTGPVQQYSNLPAKYEIKLTNKGKGTATNTQVIVRLPEKLKFVKATEPGVAVENTVVWNLGQLDAGAVRFMELTLRATDKGEHCFQTTAKADLGVQKEVETCTKFAGSSAMSIEMYGRKGAYLVGDKGTYPIEVVSQGSEPLTNIEVRAFIPTGLKLERTNAAFDEMEAVPDGKWIKFKTLPSIDGGKRATYELYVEAISPLITRVKTTVMADQLREHGPVSETELVHIVDDRGQK